MINIHVLEVPKVIHKNDYIQMVNLVSEKKKNKFNNFKIIENSYHSLLGDILVRHIISKEYLILNENIDFRCNKYGKPYWKEEKDFFFNISHSGKWVVCIWGNQSVGIDIEKIVPIEIDSILNNFSKQEQIEFTSRVNQERIKYFYDLWTLKESYLKCIGTGLSKKLDSFTIRIDNNGNIILYDSKIITKYYFKQYNLIENHLISVCSTSEEFPKYIKYEQLSQILNQIQT